MGSVSPPRAAPWYDGRVTRVEELYEQALELDEEELAEFLGRLANREKPATVHESWMEAIRERQADVANGASLTVPWAEVRERMFKRARGH